MCSGGPWGAETPPQGEACRALANMAADAELAELRGALDFLSGVLGGPERGQQDPDQQCDDGNDDEQLDERKRSLSRTPLARVVGQPGSPQTFTTPVSPSDEAELYPEGEIHIVQPA